ncbi:MAG: hypothetical protein IH623_16570 [Verrucomicrobia bacterium]|nr:hypothetical protein [Verrucomicrobiota bacterium]
MMEEEEEEVAIGAEAADDFAARWSVYGVGLGSDGDCAVVANADLAVLSAGDLSPSNADWGDDSLRAALTRPQGAPKTGTVVVRAGGAVAVTTPPPKGKGQRDDFWKFDGRAPWPQALRGGFNSPRGKTLERR